ncbi:MAG: ATP-dependent DNA helicase [Candidatus Nanopelagicales bacterium]
MRDVKVELDFSLKSTPHIELDPAQAQALELNCPSLLITGATGTGKSLLLEAMALDALARQKIAPEKILFIAFSRQQAKAVRSRLAAQANSYVLPKITTFHSFAYGVVQQVVNQDPELAIFENLKLLSGPEQEVRLNELLVNAVKDKAINWPEELKFAVGTYGLTQQVRNLLARVRALGLDPSDLTKLGQLHDNPLWIELGKFGDIYLDVLDAQNMLDYSEVVHRASLYLAQESLGQILEPKPKLVLVDEYQDIDPAQVRLLKALNSLGCKIVCAGDINSSIYSFRGADATALEGFNEDFVNSQIINLEKNHRRQADFSQEIKTFENASIQAAQIVSQIRELRKNHELAWSEIAIIGRGSETLSEIYRELTHSEIPAEMDEIENPVYQDSAVKVILDLIELALTDSEEISESLIERVLEAPLIDYPKSDLRKTVSEIRDLLSGRKEETPSTAEAIKQAYLNPQLLLELGPSAWGLRKLSGLVLSVQQLISTQASIYSVLWQVFSERALPEFIEQFQIEMSTNTWQERLYQSALRGERETYLANKSLDSILALFDMASREDESQGSARGLASFIQELKVQQFAQETIAQKAQRSAVQLLTAHSTKGREWQAVFIVDLQEGVWPSDKLRNTLLEAERIEQKGYSRKFSRNDLINEEQRLFQVAVSRAKQFLYLSCIKNDYDDKSNPSQFLFELVNNAEIEHSANYPQSYLSLTDLIVQLRQTLISQTTSTELKKIAALRINNLLNAQDGFGNYIAPNLAPNKWWGVKSSTASEVSLRDPNSPVTISASQIKTLSDCSLKWFFDNDGGARLPKAQYMSVGSIVHALAKAIVKEEVKPEINSMTSYVEAIWPKIEFDAEWVSLKEKESAHEMLKTLIKWHQADRKRDVVAVEETIKYVHKFDELNDSIKISGRIDRIEADQEDPDSIYVVDFKTSKKAPTGPEAKKDPQLGAYLLAVAGGGLKETLQREVKATGAELVELRDSKKGEARVLASADIKTNGVLKVLQEGLRVIRSEAISANRCSACNTCSYKKICPAQSEGRGVI